VYQLIDEFFSKNGLDWKTKLGFICTGGAPSMLGKKSRFGALVQVEAPQVVIIHCFLHRHSLASKTLSPRLKSAMDTAVQGSELHPVSSFEPQTLQNILPRSWSCS
jgi:hypothetical protein